MNGSHPRRKDGEPLIQSMIRYQVCDDSDLEPGMPPFNVTGDATMFDDIDEALMELDELRFRYPNTYLAKVTYERVQTSH